MLSAIVTSILVTALVLMLAFPQTPSGKWLHRILVAPLAQFSADFTWAKLGQVLISIVIVLFLASIGPQGIALLVAAGVDAAMLEVLLTFWLLLASSSIGTGWRTATRVAAKFARLLLAVSAPRNRSRAPRRRKYRPSRKADDPNEPGWAFA
jgi:hypothetical protein